MSTAAEKFVRASSEMGRLEARIRELAKEKAAAIREMRAEGMAWAEIEAATGLTRQRLDKIAKDYA